MNCIEENNKGCQISDMCCKLRSIVIFYFLFTLTATSQKFECDGTIFLTQYNTSTGPTQLIEVIEDSTSVKFDTITEYGGKAINAIGFNYNSGFIYGTSVDGEVVRLDKHGNANVLGLDPTARRFVQSGEVSSDGIYVTLQRIRGELSFYQVEPTYQKIRSKSLYWDPTSGNSGPITRIFADIVYHPDQPKTLISYQPADLPPANTQGFVVYIDADPNSASFGMVTPVFMLDPLVVQGMGALLTSPSGKILGYGKSSGQGTPQNKLYQIDIDNQSISNLGTGPEARGLDGCSCPFVLKLNKTVDSVYYGCDSTFITYEFRLINKGLSDYFDITVIDSLDLGGRFLDVSNNMGTISPDRQVLSLPFSSIGPQQRFVFYASVRVANSALPYSNQAYIKGIWKESSSVVLSDDTTTIEDLDSTMVDTGSINELITTLIDTISICDGDSIMWNGKVITQEGTYESRTDNGGCDTLFKLNTRIIPAYSRTDTIRICIGDSIYYNDQWLSREGVYKRALTSVDGCDSIISLQLEVDSLINADIAEYLCPNTSIRIKDLVIDSVGQYFTTTDGPNCDTLWNITVSTPPGIQPEVDLDKACPGSQTGRLELLKNSVTSFDTFYWSTGASSFIIDSLREGRYSLNIIDTFGCLTSHEFIIEEEVSPELDVDIQKADCHNDFLGLVIIASSDSTSRFSFNNGPATKTNRYESPGGSKVHIVNHFNGCVQDTSVAVPRVDTIDPALNIRFSGECGSMATLSVDFNSSDTSAIENVTFSGFDSIYSNQNNQVITLKAYQSGKVTAIVQDTHGCIYRRDAQLEVIDDYRIWVPNAFTPNGDNINDVFHIYASECVDRIEKFQVFDRWGELVFEALDFLPEEKGWNGQLNNEIVNPGVYTYRVLFTDKSGESDEFTGSVTLLK